MSKAIADRIDIGIIATKIRPIDEEIVNGFVEAGYIKPNYILSFYKVRRGKYAGTKLWCDVDLGTCRCRGLFITDSNNVPLPIDKTTIRTIKRAEEKLIKESNLVDNKPSAF